MKHILKCKSCGKFTMKERCCSEKTIIPKPPKYTSEDKYGKYRREYKKNEKK